ncbi:MAG: ABC transporter ATP-binding protein [Anaerococcus sp.]|nr:ABC transporter ATP-binding protein [Anaerococcus sp.]
MNRSYFSIVCRNSKEYFKKSSWRGILEQVIALLLALSLVGEVIITKILFDNISNITSFQKIAKNLILLISVIILQQLLSGFGQYLLSRVSYTNMGKFMVEFQLKLSRFPLIYFENTEFLDKVTKAKECLEYESLGHFASICLKMITHYSVYLLAIAGFLIYTSPLLVIILLLSFIPAILAQIIKGKYYIDLENAIASEKRRCDSYKKSIISTSSYKETRILGAYHYFFNIFNDSLHILTEKRWKIEKKTAFLEIGINSLVFIGLGISMYILFSQMMTGQISIGMFSALFVTLSDLFDIMDEMVSYNIGQGSEVIGQVASFYDLMDMEEVEEDCINPNFNEGIVAKNIFFKYPSRSSDALSDVSLNINKGETVAIVGENGSGKSTFVNNLIGLYNPYKGLLKIGGIEHKGNLSRGNFKNISAVFQDFQKYKLTLAENVIISDIGKLENFELISTLLKQVGFYHPSAKLTTVLSPEFSGIDLSIGQWQRLAIARGLYRSFDFIILDEPTASIDPIEESKIFENFENIVANRTAVIITHRMASAKFADRIIVMDKGRIVECGSHEDLLKNKGKYYTMWQAQAKWYQDY